MALTTFNDIFVEMSKPEKIIVLGREVYCRVMSGAERDEWDLFYDELVKDEKPRNSDGYARYAELTLSDAWGNRIVKDGDGIKLNSKFLHAFFKKAIKVNGLSKEGDDDAKKDSGDQAAATG